MPQTEQSVDKLYGLAENLAQDFSLFPRRDTSLFLKGVLSERHIEAQLEALRTMDVDQYIERTVKPVEETTRPGAREIIAQFNRRIVREIEDGPMYAAEIELDFGGELRNVGFIAQDRSVASGAWGPQHHELAAQCASDFAIRSLPIVNMIDTPGADGGEEANSGNQAHSISRLIAELCNVDVPTIGIVLGQGYSGGAIPLAASNLLLSLRTGVFNTIHPRSLVNLTQRFNLSWQECAKFVGVSPFELYAQGNIDGIVDYEPGDPSTQNLIDVIVSGISAIENSTKQFVVEHPEILEHYHRNINRYLNLSESLAAVHASSTLKLRTSPSEYPNVFGVAFRYLRYLGLRRRIRTTTTNQYGRLANRDIPPGELAERVHRERRAAFLGWLQDPDLIIYDDVLSKSWKNFADKRLHVGDERGRIAQLIFGEPQKNYEDARRDLCLVTGLHLYNRWKAGAKDNLGALVAYLEDIEDNQFLLRPADIRDVRNLLTALDGADTPFINALKARFSYEGKKLFDIEANNGKSDGFLVNQLVSELNLILEGPSLYDEALLEGQGLSTMTTDLLRDGLADGASAVPLNRRLLEDTLWSHVERQRQRQDAIVDQDRTILDVVLEDDVREHFINECRNLVVFATAYENLVDDLVSVARQANDSHTLSETFLAGLVDSAVTAVQLTPGFGDLSEQQIRDSFAEWVTTFGSHSRCAPFLKSVEEWMRVVHKDKSDTLFVIVSFIFERVLPEYYGSLQGARRYEGKINPVRIGRRKDFWNRLTIAYRDLLFNEVLNREKKMKRSGWQDILGRYVDNFEEHYAELMTADPVDFPALRPSIEKALSTGVTPCGLITGFGDFRTDNGSYRAGIVVSNLDFQVGCIDNASCEKFCKLLVECANLRLPVICFVSSGGMQTKEGAAALFSMAVINDRITRFVRDNDLPVIMFGYGDCMGGAQASFVTHPLAQTYYFSGTKMPFAGQAVIESNLPFTCQLSNYLSVKPGAMNGLVIHPFADDLDEALREVDPALPLPTETVEQVVDRIMQGSLTADAPVVPADVVAEADLIRPVRRTLIHARGCTAVKLVRKAQEHGYEVVLVQSDPDMDSVPTDMVQARPGDSVVSLGGNTSDESYLNAASVLAVAEAEGVDSLHPGIGFLSEDPNFAKLMRDHRINFIGPPVSSMETMGNKSNAINTTINIGVPVVPGSHGIVSSSERAAEIAEEIGYPVLLKAVHGGGGKGIQVVEREGQIHSLFQQVTTEARSAFGNGDVYIEKFVTSLRHIEVQILRDTHGTTQVLGLRDCSVQRNNQKLMEESGSTMLPAELRQQVFDYARKIADAVSYVGAGTVEFIYDVPSNAVYFMEMNTRLQVEHPVTEMVTDVDIVKHQFEIASGGSIADLDFEESGYALEVRINAERIQQDAEGNVSFVPTPGLITRCELPGQADVDVMSMAATGKSVSPFYDSLVAQIIVKGEDRADTTRKMIAYLDNVKIEGICTNIPLIKRILADEQFTGGEYDTGYLPAFLARTDIPALIAEIEAASGMSAKGMDLEQLRIEGSDEIKVLSPSTGVFYTTPSPSEPDYVAVNDVISTEDVLFQMEAMKMFTPITLKSFSGEGGELYPSDTQYQVTRINNVSGQQVNEGDLLFVLKPIRSVEAA